MVLNCPDTGWPICILDAIWVTAKRTPAVTALACESLARKDTTVAGIAGAGVQGREHVLVLPQGASASDYHSADIDAPTVSEVRVPLPSDAIPTDTSLKAFEEGPVRVW